MTDVQFPSHVDITFDEAADEIAEGVTRECEMDMKSLRALKQERINIKSMQLGDDEALESEAMERYFKTLHASGGQHFTSGRSRTNGKTMCI